MHAATLDPRDIRWEQDLPTYRVYFYERAALGPEEEDGHSSWGAYEWRLTGATDVHEVLAWATGPEGRGRRFELFVEWSTAEGTGLLRLAGENPNAV